jgi:hypothetical protein
MRPRAKIWCMSSVEDGAGGAIQRIRGEISFKPALAVREIIPEEAIAEIAAARTCAQKKHRIDRDSVP